MLRVVIRILQRSVAKSLDSWYQHAHGIAVECRRMLKVGSRLWARALSGAFNECGEGEGVHIQGMQHLLMLQALEHWIAQVAT